MALSKRERVLCAATVLSAYRFVMANPTIEERWQADEKPVGSGDVADLVGIPVSLVEAIVRENGVKHLEVIQ